MERPKILSKKQDTEKNLEKLKAELQKIEATPPPEETAAPRVAKTPKPRGRKKRQTEPLHRLTIDLPLTLFQTIEAESDAQYTTIRGRIVSILSAHYQQV